MVTEVKERLARKEQRAQRFYMERFSLKKLNEIESKEKYCLRSKIGVQLWNIRTLKWKLIELGKRLERLTKF
jgi:hypothetical protein